MTDLERGPSSDGESAICATSLNKPSSQEGLKLAERLRAVVGEDHDHDCPLRNTGCSCGYDTGRDDLNLEAADAIDALQAERDRIKAFLSEGSWDTIESEQAWKRRALAAESRHPSFNDAIEAWQPIETVLKDGSDVLLYFPLEGLSADWPKIVIGHWRTIDDTRGHWVWQSRAFRGYSDEYQPTHWQPLPPPRSLKLPDYRGGE